MQCGQYGLSRVSLVQRLGEKRLDVPVVLDHEILRLCKLFLEVIRCNLQQWRYFHSVESGRLLGVYRVLVQALRFGHSSDTRQQRER